MAVVEQDLQIPRLRAGVGSLMCAGRVCTSPHVVAACGSLGYELTMTRGRLYNLFVQLF